MALKKVEIKRGIFPDHKPQPAQELSSQREFTFFAKPRWKKLTEYEKLLLYAQPNPDWIPGGLDWGDWPSASLAGVTSGEITSRSCAVKTGMRSEIQPKGGSSSTFQRRATNGAYCAGVWLHIRTWNSGEALTRGGGTRSSALSGVPFCITSTAFLTPCHR